MRTIEPLEHDADLGRVAEHPKHHDEARVLRFITYSLHTEGGRGPGGGDGVTYTHRLSAVYNSTVVINHHFLSPILS